MRGKKIVLFFVSSLTRSATEPLLNVVRLVAASLGQQAGTLRLVSSCTINSCCCSGRFPRWQWSGVSKKKQQVSAKGASRGEESPK